MIITVCHVSQRPQRICNSLRGLRSSVRADNSEPDQERGHAVLLLEKKKRTIVHLLQISAIYSNKKLNFHRWQIKPSIADRTLSQAYRYDNPFTVTMRSSEFLNFSTSRCLCKNSKEWGWVEQNQGEIWKSNYNLKGQLGLVDWA